MSYRATRPPRVVQTSRVSLLYLQILNLEKFYISGILERKVQEDAREDSDGHPLAPACREPIISVRSRFSAGETLVRKGLERLPSRL